MSNPDLGILGTVKGSMIGMKIGDDFVSCETNSSFDFDVEMLPTSPIDGGRWSSSIPGIRSWTMTVDGNMLLRSVGADIKTVLNAVLTGERLHLEFRTRMGINPEVAISGWAYPQTGNITAPLRGKTTWNVRFQGDGPFEIDVEDFWLIINNMPIDNDYQTIVEQDWDDW